MDNLQSRLPQLLEIETNATNNNLFTIKSSRKYEKEYKKWNDWCSQNNVTNLTENHLIAYFELMGETKKSSTLWTTYSMLHTMLNTRQNIDISKFANLKTLLKTCSEGYEPKKSKILEIDDINRFINDAPDNMYLAMKIALIMGYCGACRRHELINIKIDDIEYKTDTIHVTVPKTNTNARRFFAITNQHWINLIKAYASIRPSHTTHQRFFLSYNNGHCTTQPIGINKMGQMPKLIAVFLKLPNPNEFSGHCFRRSSVSSLAVNRGFGDLITIRNHGGWKSSDVAEASLKRQIELAHTLSSQSETSSSTEGDLDDCYRARLKRKKYSKDRPRKNENDKNNILKEVLVYEPQIIYSEHEEEGENSESSARSQPSCSKKKEKSKQTKRAEEETEESLKVFFDSMCAATKRLPKHLQQRIKRLVFQIVCDAEAEADNPTVVSDDTDFSNNTHRFTPDTPDTSLTNSNIKVEPPDAVSTLDDFTCNDINKETINKMKDEHPAAAHDSSPMPFTFVSVNELSSSTTTTALQVKIEPA